MKWRILNLLKTLLSKNLEKLEITNCDFKFFDIIILKVQFQADTFQATCLLESNKP